MYLHSLLFSVFFRTNMTLYGIKLVQKNNEEIPQLASICLIMPNMDDDLYESK
jgi:hypothetical protein